MEAGLFLVGGVPYGSGDLLLLKGRVVNKNSWSRGVPHFPASDYRKPYYILTENLGKLEGFEQLLQGRQPF